MSSRQTQQLLPFHRQIKTTTAAKLLSPIANQVTTLMLVHEAYQLDGRESVVPETLGTDADHVASACSELATATLRFCTLSSEESVEKLCIACGVLETVSKNLSLFSHKLALTPSDIKYHTLYISSCKELLGCLYQLMGIVEEVDVSKIEQLASWVKDRLNAVVSCETCESLLPVFKQYTDAVLKLLSLTAKRQNDLISEEQKQALGMAAIVLKKVAPMVNKSCQMSLKYPNNTQAKESLKQIEGDVLQAISDIIDIVKKDWPADRTEETFVHKLDQVLEMLKSSSDTRHIDLIEKDIQSMVIFIITHAILVSRTSGDNLSERQRVVQSSRQVLCRSKQVDTSCKNLKTNSTMVQLRRDLEDQIAELISELHDLEHHVNALLIYQVIEHYKETNEPLERLIRSVALHQLNSIKIENSIHYLAFSSHADDIYNVSNYVADSSADHKCVSRIRASIHTLERIDTEILPSLTSYQHHPTDISNVEQLQLIKNRWCKEINSLRDLIDSISDSIIYVEVTETQVQTHLDESFSFVTSSELSSHGSELSSTCMAEFSSHVRSITALIKHLLVVLHKHVTDDYTSQQKLEIKSNQLESVSNGLRSAANQLLIKPRDHTVKQAYSKRGQLLMKCLNQIKLILNNEEVSDRDGREEYEELKENADYITPSSLQPFADRPVSTGASKWLGSEAPTLYTQQPAGFVSEDVDVTNIVSPQKVLHIELDINDLISRLLEAVIVFKSTEAELVSTQILERTNQTLEVANQITPYAKTDHKQTIQQLISSLTKHTVDLPKLAALVSQHDIGQLPDLKSACSRWGRDLGMLDICIDEELGEIGELSNGVVDCLELKNGTMLNMALEKFHTAHRLFIDCCKLADQFNITDLRNSLIKIEELSTLISTAVLDSDIGSMRMTGRRWSSCVYSSIYLIHELRQTTFKQLNMSDVNTSSSVIGTTEYVQGMMKSVTVCLPNSTVECTNQFQILRTIFEEWVSTEPDNSVLSFTKFKDDILLTAWCSQLTNCYKAIDEHIESDCSTFYHLAFTAFEVLAAEGDHKQTALATYRTMKSNVQSYISSISTCLTKLRTVKNQTHLSEITQKLDKYSRQLIQTADQLTEKSSDSLLITYKSFQRSLVCLLLEVRCELSLINPTQIHLAQECEEYLCKLISDWKIPSCGNQLQPSSHPSSHSISESLVSKLKSPSKPSINQPSSTDIDSPSKSSATFNQQVISPSKMTSLRKLFTESPFKAAVRRYQGNLENWVDNNNPVVKAAREIAQSLSTMSHYIYNRDGPIDSHHHLFALSHNVVTLSKTITKFTLTIAKYSLADWRLSEALMYHSNQIEFYAQQLHLLTCVKQSTESYDITVRDLIKITDNLMNSVIQSLEKSESICLKGLKEPTQDAHEEQLVFNFATRWRASLDKHRKREILYTDVNDLGLRVISRNHTGPHMSEICKP